MANPKDNAPLGSPQIIGKLKNKYLARLERLATNDPDFLLLLETFANANNDMLALSVAR
jgi:hypothetical protein